MARRRVTRGAAAGLGVLLVDLDDLHRINEALGRPAGDAVLREVARRLRTAVPADRIVPTRSWT